MPSETALAPIVPATSNHKAITIGVTRIVRPTDTDAWTAERIIVAWRLLPEGPEPVLFPAVETSKDVMFVLVFMPDGRLLSLDGRRLFADVQHAKGIALMEAQRNWDEQEG
jgi:hypothetical protein